MGWKVFIWLAGINIFVAGLLAAIWVVVKMEGYPPGPPEGPMLSPTHVAVAYWFLYRFPCYAVIAIITLPAPFGFLRVSRGKDARWFLLPYTVATIAVGGSLLGSLISLAYQGEILWANGSVYWVSFGDFTGEFIGVALVLIPGVAAIFALLRGGRQPAALPQGTPASPR